jgi:hypothetical protein
VSWVSLIAKRLLATAAPFAKSWDIGISPARGCNKPHGFVRVCSREALSIFSGAITIGARGSLSYSQTDDEPDVDSADFASGT